MVAQSTNIAQVDSELFRERLKIAADGPLTTWLEGLGLKDTVYSALSRKSVPGPEVLVRLSMASWRSIDWLLGLTDITDQVRGPEGAIRKLDAANGRKAQESDEGRQYAAGGRRPYTPDDGEFVFVRRYDLKVSAGEGGYFTDEHVIGRYAYQREWWMRNMEFSAADCAIIECDGRSMEPDIYDREPMLIHLADKGMSADAVYVFRLGSRLLVKRLQVLPDGLINVISTNKENYPPYTISQDVFNDPEAGAIIARVLGVPGDFRWIK